MINRARVENSTASVAVGKQKVGVQKKKKKRKKRKLFLLLFQLPPLFFDIAITELQSCTWGFTRWWLLL